MLTIWHTSLPATAAFLDCGVYIQMFNAFGDDNSIEVIRGDDIILGLGRDSVSLFTFGK